MNNFERKLDDKNRLTIPVEVRPEFEKGFIVLTKGYDNTLALYSQDYWEQVIEPALEGDFRDVESFRLNRQIQGVNAFRVKTAGGRSYWAIEASNA
jgi:DNA-binding transcriptional regulator/RsmH inhibitor MraZ